MSDPLKQLPTLEKVAGRVAQLHEALSQLGQAMGVEVAQLNETLKQSTAITDQTLEEMALQITFLMQTIRVSKPIHGGLADVNGQVKMEVKTASQIYQETGRAKLLAGIAEARRAQGLPTAEDAAAASGEANGAAPSDGANPEVEAVTGPRLITH